MKKLWATLLVVVMIMGAVNSFAYFDNNYTGHRPYASSNEKTVPSWLQNVAYEYGARFYVDPNQPVTRLDVFFSIARMLESKFERDGITFSTVSYAPFSDMGHLEYSCVPLAAGLYNRGILRGYDDGTAKLPQNITRAEFTAVVNRLAHLTGKIGYGYSYYGMYPQFADVKGHWAESVICETAAAGMMSGVGNNMFHPEGLVTYAQLFKVLSTFVDDGFGLQMFDVAYGCTNTWDVDFDVVEEDDEEDAGTKITSLTATESTIRIAVGEEVKTKVKINPSDATNKTLSWEAQSERTVFVNDYYTSGNYGYVVIEGNKVGTTYIVGSATDGSKKTVKIKVVVTEEEEDEEDDTVYVSSIKVSPSDVELAVGESQTITATVKPSNASNKGIRWESHNEAVATVSTSGKITAVGVGNTTVTCTAKDGSGVVATIDVTVTAEEIVPDDETAPVVELTGADNVAVGQKVTLTAKVDEGNLEEFEITEKDLLGLTGGASINKIKKVSDDTYEITLMGVEVSSLALCIDAGVATDVAGNTSAESNEVVIFINSGEDI